jgi:3-phosphoshikimate 1-carboxyvinyltransferase
MTAGRHFAACGPLRGRLRVPGDKSIMQRALLIGAVSDGPVEIVNPVWAGDPLSTAHMVADLGAEVEGVGGRAMRAVVHGLGLRGLRAPGHSLYAGNSGTGMRLLAGLLAGQRGRFVIDGDRSLRARPMARIIQPLRAMGVTIAARDDRFAPLTIEGGTPRPIHYRLPVASAQVKSCILLAGLFADGETVVTEPLTTRDHTERMLAAAGVAVRRHAGTVSVRGADRLCLERVVVPGDPSSAAFLVAAALLVPGSSLELDDVGLNPTKAGFFEVVRAMGADVSWHITAEDGGEPRGVVRVAHSPLHGIRISAGQTSTMIDEVTLVALLASFAEGETVIEGVADLRSKESDRLAAIVAILRGLGGDAEAREGQLRVGGRRLHSGVVASLDDHRLALLGAVAGLAIPGGVTVAGFEAADVSFPGFERALAEVSSP